MSCFRYSSLFFLVTWLHDIILYITMMTVNDVRPAGESKLQIYIKSVDGSNSKQSVVLFSVP